MSNPITLLREAAAKVRAITSAPVVTNLELRGVIGEGFVGRRGLAQGRMADAIEAAFKPKRLAAVALSINSPGGSPVQSRMIYQAVRRAAEKKKVPVYAFIEDVGASGGYILALAADEIYADASSVVGSIGVISAGFGFQEAMARFGVERRIHTAGESKSQLDPFRREDPKDVERLKAILDDLHAQFIALVRERRGEKLSGAPDTFTGAFWTAGPARERGLIDGTAHLTDFMKARFGETVKIRTVGGERVPLLRRLVGGEGALPRGLEALPEAAWGAAEARDLWARYGL
ncbi:MAG: S49 family peptidase [Amphiplicatus sp.]|nr:S49 family peptidase [Amphiplicatus sp.]